MKIQLIIFLVLGLAPFILTAQYNPKALEKVEETIVAFKEKNSKFEIYFADAYGYTVFPAIGKGAWVLGAARGGGTAFELGEPTGKAIITQFTIGLQFGGQCYRQVIFFEKEEDFLRFKENKFEFAAQTSALAVKLGAAANLSYRDGVAVFSITKAGFMYEASLGGQKLKFKPYKLTKQVAEI
ncbi:MAG: lipid-binding SYLF domain-containing protein [Saprospiraceae bacterium]|jgi:lipid-binding SYLF domain-containing protein